jgi:hypothetical protein
VHRNGDGDEYEYEERDAPTVGKVHGISHPPIINFANASLKLERKSEQMLCCKQSACICIFVWMSYKALASSIFVIAATFL